jgi:quercetin dioxygenase-like cupin family protein
MRIPVGIGTRNRYSVEASRRGPVKLCSLLATLAILFPLAIAVSRSQDVVSVAPGVAKVEFENDQIRVLRISLAPHQKSPMHSHPGLYVVTLTEGDVRISLPDGKSRTVQRPAHRSFWSEAVTHQTENLSDKPMQNIEIELKQPKGPGAEIKPAAAASNAQGTEADPVPVEAEPHHHAIFENQYVRVLEVIVNPGDTTLFHKHSLDNVAVQLSDTQLKRQSPGQLWIDSPAKEGSVNFVGGTKQPYTHRITNTGSTVFHVLDIEILP